MNFTAAKAKAAAVGATLTALMTAWSVASVALNDGKIESGEIATLVTTAITLVGTVYAVWRTPNKVIPPSGVGINPR